MKSSKIVEEKNIEITSDDEQCPDCVGCTCSECNDERKILSKKTVSMMNIDETGLISVERILYFNKDKQEIPHKLTINYSNVNGGEDFEILKELIDLVKD